MKKPPTPAPKEANRLLTAKTVASMLAVGVRTVWRMTASGQLPQPRRFNRKLVRWPRRLIVAYLKRVAAEAEAA